MKRRDFLGRAVFALIAVAVAPLATTVGEVATRVAPSTRRIEWVIDEATYSKQLIIDHVAMATFPRNVQLTVEGMARYVVRRDLLARAAQFAERPLR